MAMKLVIIIAVVAVASVAVFYASQPTAEISGQHAESGQKLNLLNDNEMGNVTIEAGKMILLDFPAA